MNSSEIPSEEHLQKEIQKTGKNFGKQLARQGRWIENDLKCTDVSTYGDVKFVTEQKEKCEASFPKRLIPREKRVSEFWIENLYDLKKCHR